MPVTAKIRIGWDANSVNALEIVKTLEGEGIQAIAVHGRTRAQGYTGEADWDVIAQCAEAASVPIIGNGDLASGADIKLRRDSTLVSGVMIGRAAMANPWIFREAKHYLETGEILPSVSMEDRWALILRHTRLALASDRYGEEIQTMRAMRSRLMAYSRGLPEGKRLRSRFAQVSSVTELEDIAAEYLAHECQAA